MLAVAHVLGLLLATFALAYVLPVGCSLLSGDGLLAQFLAAAAITAALGLVIAAATWRFRRELKPRDGFLLVTLGWVLMSAAATMPLLLALPNLSFTAAYFETMSGLTTTGSTVLTGLDAPAAVGESVARTPAVVRRPRHHRHGARGAAAARASAACSSTRAHAPGTVKEERLAPRITETAKSLWLVYALLTAAGIVALRLAGMSWFDAVCHAFSAVGLGGFSTHDASIAYFNSAAIEVVLMVLMVIAALNFARHFSALRRLSLATYRQDPEARAIFVVLALSVAGIALLLNAHGVYPRFALALRHSAFNVISQATTSGLTTQDYQRWPVFAPYWMLFLSCILCSTGSTGGGIKMFRTLLLARQAGREMQLLIHPAAIAPLRIGGRPIADSVGRAVLAFIFLYFMTAALLTFALLLTGMEFDAAFGAVVASINNTAHGFGPPGGVHNLHALTPMQTWICTAAMLLGRLEIFSVLVLFRPAYWRK